MKIIFLDIDGVICTFLSFWLSEVFHRPLEKMWFDPVSLFWVRRIVRKTGAKLVLSSSWRDALTAEDSMSKAFISNLYAAMERNKTPFLDATPPVESGWKGGEITRWLEEHPCDHYVVLDDHDCFADADDVRSHWIPVPEGKGIGWREAAQAVRMLKGDV